MLGVAAAERFGVRRFRIECGGHDGRHRSEEAGMAMDVTTALALANATEPLSRLEEAFENKYGLAGCP